MNPTSPRQQASTVLPHSCAQIKMSAVLRREAAKSQGQLAAWVACNAIIAFVFFAVALAGNHNWIQGTLRVVSLLPLQKSGSLLLDRLNGT